MRLETIHFFGEVLRGDMSIFQFLDSDFTCVNDRLAAHYGIAGRHGPDVPQGASSTRASTAAAS